MFKQNFGNFIWNYIHTRRSVRRRRMLWSLDVRMLREVSMLMRRLNVIHKVGEDKYIEE